MPVRWLYAAAALVAAGIILLVVFGTDDAMGIVGGAVLSLGAIVAIGVAFYTVGRSEDVARERGEE